MYEKEKKEKNKNLEFLENNRNKMEVGGDNMKRISMLVVCALLMLTLFHLNLDALQAYQPKKPLQIFVTDPKTSGHEKQLLEKVKQVRGGKIENDGKFSVHVKDHFTPTDQAQYDAFVFKEKDVTPTLKKSIQTLVTKGKIVYLYGTSVSSEKAASIFGVPFETTSLTKEQIRKELKESGYKEGKQLEEEVIKEMNAQHETYNVVGVIQSKKGTKQLYVADIQQDKKDPALSTNDTSFFVDLIIDNVNHQHLKSTSIFSGNQVKAGSEPIVKSWVNKNSTLYIGSKKVATLNADYYLQKDNDERDKKRDYFVLQSNMELINYNGARNQRLHVKHDVPLTTSELQDWDPRGKTGSSFSVSLPWGISWNFNTGARVKVTDYASTTYDYATWLVSRSLFSLNLPSPVEFRPGSAWTSTGTYAAVNVDSYGEVAYKGADRKITQFLKLRYDYK